MHASGQAALKEALESASDNDDSDGDDAPVAEAYGEYRVAADTGTHECVPSRRILHRACPPPAHSALLAV